MGMAHTGILIAGGGETRSWEGSRWSRPRVWMIPYTDIRKDVFAAIVVWTHTRMYIRTMSIIRTRPPGPNGKTNESQTASSICLTQIPRRNRERTANGPVAGNSHGTLAAVGTGDIRVGRGEGPGWGGEWLVEWLHTLALHTRRPHKNGLA